jgi:cyanate lyase
MNEQHLVARLAQAADHLGLDASAVARRAELPEALVSLVLAGQVQASLDTLVALAAALELEVRLEPAEIAQRVVGPVPTVVDRAVERVAPERSVYADGAELPRGAAPPSTNTSALSSTP